MVEKRIFGLYDMNYYEKNHYKDFLNNSVLNRAESLVSDLKLGELIEPIEMMMISAEYDSEMYHKIKSSYQIAAEKYKIKISENLYSVECTAKEMSNASFYKLGLGIYGHEDYTEGNKTEYDDVYCSICGAHRLIPRKEVYINKSEFRGKDISCSNLLNNEILVSDKVKKLIESNNLTGAKFYTAYHWNNRLKNDYPVWHMSITSIMPPIDKSMDMYIAEGYCKVCKCHHIMPLSYVRYKKCELEQGLDFNLSSERFGAGWYGSPILIVSRRVYNTFKDNKIKGCRFEIVGEI